MGLERGKEMSHFITYMLHYVIARTVYDGARSVGVSPVVMVAVAVVALVVVGTATRFGFGRARIRRQARWREEARLDARRRWQKRQS
jgi:hypothetical protein